MALASEGPALDDAKDGACMRGLLVLRNEDCGGGMLGALSSPSLVRSMTSTAERSGMDAVEVDGALGGTTLIALADGLQIGASVCED